MVSAAIVAGGRGERFGGGIPKQFLPVRGRPVLIRSLDAFIGSGLCDDYVVAVAEDQLEATRRLLAEYLRDAPVRVTAGGANRNGTLLNILNTYEDPAEDDVILTHDAVRPCIDSRIIADNIEAAYKYGACNTVVPAVDTVLMSADGSFITSVPPRSACYHAQTPQSFRLKKLRDIYRSMTDEELETYTDACGVFVARGEPVYMVRGDLRNIKITYPADLKTAEDFFD